MKRCSQCEFTFDDEQKVCDFDGTELVPLIEPPAIPPSRVRSLRHSSLPLVLVMIAAVLSSALLVGYYDSAEQSGVNVSSNTETRDFASPLISPAEVDTRAQAATSPDRPKSISTQRRISTVRGAAPMPGSAIRWPSEKSHLRSSRSSRRPLNSQLTATNSKRRKAAPGLAQQRRSVARLANSKCGSGRLGCNDARSSAESTHHAKDSKLVAFFKTTGRLLKKPFTF